MDPKNREVGQVEQLGHKHGEMDMLEEIDNHLEREERENERGYKTQCILLEA